MAQDSELSRLLIAGTSPQKKTEDDSILDSIINEGQNEWVDKLISAL